MTQRHLYLLLAIWLAVFSGCVTRNTDKDAANADQVAETVSVPDTTIIPPKDTVVPTDKQSAPDAAPDTADLQPPQDQLDDGGDDAQTDTSGADLTDDASDDAGNGDSSETQGPPIEGSIEKPFVVDQFPKLHRWDTLKGQPSRFDHYSCIVETDESGPEVVYQVVVPEAGTLRVRVQDPVGVDVDVHLLSSLAVSNKVATDCVARNDKTVEEQVSAGTYYVVADTWVNGGGTVLAGEYTLLIEFEVPDKWMIVDVAPGLRWRKQLYTSLYGGKQTVNVLEIDLGHPNIQIQPARHNGCETTSSVALQGNVLAAINGGFFDGSGTCGSKSMVRINGTPLSLNNVISGDHPTFGILPPKTPVIESIANGTDWTEPIHALGGYPHMVTNGVVDIVPNGTGTFFDNQRPRTGLCLDANSKVLLIVVEGDAPAPGVGMTIAQFAEYLVNLGCKTAMNLDGGGSSTMWVRDMSFNGLVHVPGDGSERKVGDSLQIYSN